MDRIIEIKVNGSHITKDNRNAGVRGEANSKNLRIEFDAGWDRYAKSVTFWNALGQNPVRQELTADKLENAAQSTRVYLCPIPGEAMEEAGLMVFVIDGAVNGKKTRSIPDNLLVTDAPIDENAGIPAEPTPNQWEQMQAQYESIIGTIQQAAAAADRAEAAAIHQPIIQNGTWWVWAPDAGLYVDSGELAAGPVGPVGPIGPAGPQGDPGVYVGSGGLPDGYTVQFDPDGEYVMEAPKIVDGVWWLWDDESGEYVNSGVSATGPQGPQGEKGDPGSVGPDYVTPQMFGAVGDGVTDDTKAFRAMVSGSPDGTQFWIPEGEYLVDPMTSGSDFWSCGIEVYKRNDLRFDFAPGAVLKCSPVTDFLSYTCAFLVQASNNIIINGGEFVGDLATHSESELTANGSRRHYGILLNKTYNTTISNVCAHDFIACPLYIAGMSDGADISHSEFYNSAYHGLALEGCRNVKIDHVKAYGAYHTNYCCSIDVEGLSMENPNENIEVLNSFFGDSNNSSISIRNNINVRFVNCEATVRTSLQEGKEAVFDNCVFRGIITVANKSFAGYVFKNSVFENAKVEVEYSDAEMSTDLLFLHNVFNYEEANTEADTTSLGLVRVWCSAGNHLLTFKNNVFNVPSGNNKLLDVRSQGNKNAVVVFDGNTVNVGTKAKPVKELYHATFDIINSSARFVDNMISCEGTEDVIVTARNGTYKMFNISGGADVDIFRNKIETNLKLAAYAGWCVSSRCRWVGNMISDGANGGAWYFIYDNATDNVYTYNVAEHYKDSDNLANTTSDKTNNVVIKRTAE